MGNYNIEDDEVICELEHLRKIFVGGLAPITTEESLKKFYEQWGHIVDVVVMRDPQTKRSRGFGFVTYSRAYMVDNAQEARPHTLDGKEVEAKRALPRPELGKPELNVSVRKLFVGGLKENHDEQCLSEHFQQFGNVVSVKIIHDKTTGRKRGFGYIEFDDYDAVDKAVLQKSHSIKYVLVDVKKSVYKQELQKRGNQTGIPGDQQGGYHHQQSQPNSWGHSYNNGYQPPPPNWNYGPNNGNWNTQSAPTYQGWNQSGNPYGTPQTGYAQHDPNQQAVNWSGGFGGEYQQSFNGGPAKTNNLGTNRVNPYNGTTAPNYGVTPQGNSYGQSSYNGVVGQSNIPVPVVAQTPNTSAQHRAPGGGARRY